VIDVANEDVMIQTSHLLKETGARVSTFNADVTDLYERVRIGTKVVVLP